MSDSQGDYVTWRVFGAACVIAVGMIGAFWYLMLDWTKDMDERVRALEIAQAREDGAEGNASRFFVLP